MIYLVILLIVLLMISFKLRNQFQSSLYIKLSFNIVIMFLIYLAEYEEIPRIQEIIYPVLFIGLICLFVGKAYLLENYEEDQP